MDHYPSGIAGAYCFQAEQTVIWKFAKEQEKLDLDAHNTNTQLYQKVFAVPEPHTSAACASRVTFCGQLWHSAIPDAGNLPHYLLAIQSWLDQQPSPQLALQELDGDFLLTYMPPSGAECFLYRHITGMRGLYYRMCAWGCQWATSITDLFKDHPTHSDINPAMLAIATTNAYPEPGHTVYRDIDYLPVGTGLRLFPDGTYVQFSTQFSVAEERSLSFQEASEAYSSLLSQAIQRKIRPFKALGVLLSGGLDSSIVAYEAHKLHSTVHGLHWTWNLPVFADERACATAVAKALRIPLHIVDGTNSIQPGGNLLRSMQGVYLPFHHSFYQAFSASAEIAHRQGITAILSGHLGDLLLQGQELDAYIAPVTQKRSLSAWITTMRNLLNVYSRQEAFSVAFSLFRNKEPMTQEPFPPRLAASQDWLTPMAFQQVKARGNDTEVRQDISQSTAQTYHSIQQEINNNTSLDTTLIDHVFHPNAVHMIHPYADKRLIEFCLSLRPFHRRGFAGVPITKVLARYAYREKLPFQIIQREARTPYIAVDQTYCEHNQPEVAELFAEHSCLAQLGIIDPQAVKNIIQDPTALRKQSGPLVIASGVEVWLRFLHNMLLLPKQVPAQRYRALPSGTDFTPLPSALGKIPSNVIVKRIGATLLLLNMTTQDVIQLNADAAQVLLLICTNTVENDILTEAQKIWQDTPKDDLQRQIGDVIAQLQKSSWLELKGPKIDTCRVETH